ncbi:MAG: MFS transporter [Armatimonadota bacterium]|nr:MFS transporter [Armatimonadota bacterium]MDR7402741.1 MFS transporter [Armatimonadota bacterium]MDR7404496.1 MFS transporter [Armatimonadota bacterium]MDR7437001.1 MFS transporter [Armatimonadota bacterium]MDR7472928.1 MFS transporter [Armatimonadota bacterium]
MSRPLLLIFLIVLVNLLGFGIIIPLLPFYATRMGATPLEVGWLFASFSLAQLVAAPVLGDLSDRYGRRPVLIVSLLGTVASFVVLALARSVPVLFLARIIDGLSGGNISTARAYIGDVTSEEHRARGYGLLGAAFGVGFIAGPALGGALSRISYAAPAWAAAGIAALAALLAYRLLPETVHRVSARRPGGWTDLPAALAHPVLGRLLAADFLYWASISVYQTAFALFGARRFGFDVPQTGYLLALVGTIGAVVQVALVGPVVRRLGERRTLVVGLLLAGGGLAVASGTHRVAPFVLALVPAAVGAALATPALTSLISLSAPPGEQGRVQGVASSLEGLGRAIGPVWGNGLLGAVGETAAFGSAAGVILVTAGLAARVRPSVPAPEATAGR